MRLISSVNHNQYCLISLNHCHEFVVDSYCCIYLILACFPQRLWTVKLILIPVLSSNNWLFEMEKLNQWYPHIHIHSSPHDAGRMCGVCTHERPAVAALEMSLQWGIVKKSKVEDDGRFGVILITTYYFLDLKNWISEEKKNASNLLHLQYWGCSLQVRSTFKTRQNDEGVKRVLKRSSFLRGWSSRPQSLLELRRRCLLLK